jgi:hypothetical protein
MPLDERKPTKVGRMFTTAVLLAKEGPNLPDFDLERDGPRMIQAMLGGWREVVRIRAGALVYCRWKARGEPEQ